MNNLATTNPQEIIDALRTETNAQRAVETGIGTLENLESLENKVIGGNPWIQKAGNAGALFDITTLGNSIYDNDRGAFLKGLADIGIATVAADLTGMALEKWGASIIARGLTLAGLETAGVILGGELIGVGLLLLACYGASYITSPGTDEETEALWKAIGDYFDSYMKPTGELISEKVWDFFHQAENWTAPRRDPLALDLDGDGIETTAQDGWNSVLFDHNNDNIKTATGWLSGDDGFLVLDKNSNGTIDNGNELFGDNTKLSNGLNASDGFAALADLDSNQDGMMDANDAVFADLRVWQDLNQDGISQANELKTLDELGITSLSTTGAAFGQTQNGNIISLSSSYTNSDGTATQTANLLLSSSVFHTEFTDPIATSATDLARPDAHGAGQVRNFAEYDVACFYRIN
jgi:hypothetical protein